MRGKRLAAIAALTCGGSALLSAQSSLYHPSASVLFVRPATPPTDSVRVPQTYWKEGALIGGIPLGLLGFYAGHGLCTGDGGNDHCTMAGFEFAAMGFLIGAVPGALIGGSIAKDE